MMYYLINTDTGRVVGSSDNKNKVLNELEALKDKRSDWNTYVIAKALSKSTVRRETQFLSYDDETQLLSYDE